MKFCERPPKSDTIYRTDHHDSYIFIYGELFARTSACACLEFLHATPFLGFSHSQCLQRQCYRVAHLAPLLLSSNPLHRRPIHSSGRHTPFLRHYSHTSRRHRLICMPDALSPCLLKQYTGSPPLPSIPPPFASSTRSRTDHQIIHSLSMYHLLIC